MYNYAFLFCSFLAANAYPFPISIRIFCKFVIIPVSSFVSAMYTCSKSVHMLLSHTTYAPHHHRPVIKFYNVSMTTISNIFHSLSGKSLENTCKSDKNYTNFNQHKISIYLFNFTFRIDIFK